MDLGLAGRVALVTAASRGMGLASAKALAAEGASLIVCAREPQRLQEAAGEIQAVALQGARVTLFRFPVRRLRAEPLECGLELAPHVLSGV